MHRENTIKANAKAKSLEEANAKLTNESILIKDEIHQLKEQIKAYLVNQPVV